MFDLGTPSLETVLSQTNGDTRLLMSFVIPVILLLVVLIKTISLHGFKRHKKVPACAPPRGMDSLEAGIWYKGYASEYDFASLLFYLADKGYIEILYKNAGISKNKEFAIQQQYSIFASKKMRKLLAKKEYRIVELKRYDGGNEYISQFLDELFLTSGKLEERKTSTGVRYYRCAYFSDLLFKYYYTLKIIRKKINKDYASKVFDSASRTFAKTIPLFIFADVFCMCFNSADAFRTIGKTTFIFEAVFLFLIAMSICFAIYSNNNFLKTVILVVIPIVVVFTAPLWVNLLSPIITSKPFLAAYIVGLICIAVKLLCMAMLCRHKRSEIGEEYYAQLSGLKGFLKNYANNTSLSRQHQTQSDYYELLPFSFIFGSQIKLEPMPKTNEELVYVPKWYREENHPNRILPPSEIYSELNLAFYAFYTAISASAEWGSSKTKRDSNF